MQAMISRLKKGKRTVGLKQTLKAIQSKKAKKVFIARDADSYVFSRILSKCEEHGVEIVHVESMKELGEACGIDVGAATASLLKD